MTSTPSTFHSSLAPGFRFHPTDEELIIHYLRNKANSMSLPAAIIKELDLYKFDPWELPEKAEFGESEWYFFSPRERKYPNGERPNRAASSGFWKATGTDKAICSAGHKVGVKKALVFYRGKPPKGEKTNWIMHEYRLINNHPPRPPTKSSMLDDWVLCRIYKKRSTSIECKDGQFEDKNLCMEDVLAPLSTIPWPKQNISTSSMPYGSNDVNSFFDNIPYEHIESSSSQPNQEDIQDYDTKYLNQQYIQDYNTKRPDQQYIQDYDTKHPDQQYNKDVGTRPQIRNYRLSSAKNNEMLMQKLLNISRIIRNQNNNMQETLLNLPNLTQISPSQEIKHYQPKQTSIDNQNHFFMYAS